MHMCIMMNLKLIPKNDRFMDFVHRLELKIIREQNVSETRCVSAFRCVEVGLKMDKEQYSESKI
jgi:hypothetical protein